ncbi:PQQ-binding-like beta-propeller repeat protein [Glycomyces harbinensis]|uniref:Alcohol dehydrogenase (Cytochrome c)/quinoprotein glucose dehydrogenase n=1 Tax=Glycomyces harbinensis TaxID=58114 RepID=A0A1G6XJS6_9ACTN|nr:PQQ-binding-like beta-propeller repeat protein [Glycomyces harbinensis]SDD78474.1 alcohol dehydrogenase (cytochrome c)/quinoprotein glucose dehydrogenase [Glycomyces harbinensis]
MTPPPSESTEDDTSDSAPAPLGRRAFLTGVSLAGAAALGLPEAAQAEMSSLDGSVPGRPSHPPAKALRHFDTPGDRDFPKVGGNLGNQNFSRLKRIGKGNVRRLGGAWRNRIEGGIDEGTNQSTAVAVDGVLFIESAFGNVIAVDGATGETKWRYEQTRGSLTRRGVAVGGGRVYTHADGGWVVALDQETGAVDWERQITGYGEVGRVAVVYHGGRLFLGTLGNRAAALCVDADGGDVLWHFWGTPGPGEIGHDTWAGDSWEEGGAAPWIHPAVDPELGLVFYTFGNARGSRSSQDGSEREGMNLFANSIVALDLETGAYRWHFQSVHHDIWDMDNVMAPVLADVRIKGRRRKVVIYGSKTGMYYILDRETGEAPLGVEERPVPQDERQKSWPTQPYPVQGPWTETELVEQPLGTEVPGEPHRAVPNYRIGPLFSAHWDEPILTIPGHGGGADWSHQSYSHRTGLVYTGYGYVAAAHSLTERSNGLRPPGEYMTGGVVAVDTRTNKVKWRKRTPYSLAHGNGILTTESGLLFIGWPDGNLLCLDAEDGDELWRFQCGAAISASPIMYEAGGEEYLAVYAGGTGIPYGDSAPRGDHLWAFRIGGRLDEAETPPPPVVRRAVSGGPVEGTAVGYTVVLARTYDEETGEIGGTESTQVDAMAPTHLRVPAGTAVTFLNPGDNVHEHGATQFFEGLFDVRLAPGESFEYTFEERGEYFFNDPHSARPTGKVEVY